MIIYRIEGPSGKGVFTEKNETSTNFLMFHSIFSKEIEERHFEFPTPINDSLLLRNPKKNEFCAFYNIEDLLKWFNKKELKSLINLGFNILELNVLDCELGEFQVLYKKEYIITQTIINNIIN